jgi:hypothetical protein
MSLQRGAIWKRRDSAIRPRFDQIRIIRMIIGMKEQSHIGREFR